MSRAATGDTVVVRATNNIYTVLAGVACLVVLLGLIILIVRSRELFPPNGIF